MANPIKSLIGQTAIYGVSSIIGRFINYLLVFFYAAIFETKEYGIIGELTAYVTIFVVLLTYGMETAFFRFSNNEKYKRKAVYSTAIGSLSISTLLFCIILAILYQKIAIFIDYSANPEFILMLGITVALDAYSSIPFAQLRIENKAKRFALVKLTNILINVFLNVFLLYLLPKIFGNNNIIYSLIYPKADVGYIFISYLITSVLTLGILLPEIKRGYQNFIFDKKMLKQMLLYGFPVLFAGLAGMFTESFDRILLKYLLVVPDKILDITTVGSSIHAGYESSKNFIMSQIGIYTVNVKIAVIMTLFLQAFRYAVEPFFFNYAKNSDSKLVYAKVMKYFVAFSLFIFLGVTLFIDLIKILINSRYHSGLVVVPMLLMGKVFYGIVFNLSMWYKIKNLTKYGAYLAFIATFCSIVSNFILIPLFGIIGAAWSSLIAYFVMMVVSFILEKKNYAIPYDYKSIGLYFAVALLFYFVNVTARLFTDYYIILNFLMVFAFVFIFIRKEKVNLKSLVFIRKRK